MEIKKFRNLNNILKKNGKVIKTINESQIALNNEIRALKLLNGCCAPKLLSRFGKSLTMTEINGQHLSEVKITPVVMKKLAEALNKIHSYKSERKCFIHGDLHKDNIAITKQGIVFLDFVKSKFDDPLIDAAAVEIHITDNKNLLKSFYKIFHAKEEREKIDFYKYKHCLGHLEWAEKEETGKEYKERVEKSRRRKAWTLFGALSGTIGSPAVAVASLEIALQSGSDHPIVQWYEEKLT